MKNDIVFLVGPTAVGKTKVAMHLAKKVGAEIIALDSMQIYKGMDIITSKPSSRLRRSVPHHLIDIVSPEDEYNAYAYSKDALTSIKEIHSRNRLPLFVGGTGLYLSILLDGIFSGHSSNDAIREKLTLTAQEKGSQFLFRRLQQVDCQAAAKIHPNDAKRLIRALEVFEASGKRISELQKQRKGLAEEYTVRVFCLSMERQRLYNAINQRVEHMVAHGLIQEARRLLSMRLSKTAACAIGLKELQGYLDGIYSLAQAKEQMKHNTRLYAKRQLTWFRKDKRIIWIEIKESETSLQTAKRIISLLKRSLATRETGIERRG